MNLIDQYKILISAYYGILELDEYDLKLYLLKEIEEYIKDYIKQNPIPNLDESLIKAEVEKKEMDRKLQDALLTVPKVTNNIEPIIIIKQKLSNLKRTI